MLTLVDSERAIEAVQLAANLRQSLKEHDVPYEAVSLSRNSVFGPTEFHVYVQNWHWTHRIPSECSGLPIRVHVVGKIRPVEGE